MAEQIMNMDINNFFQEFIRWGAYYAVHKHKSDDGISKEIRKDLLKNGLGDIESTKREFKDKGDINKFKEWQKGAAFMQSLLDMTDEEEKIILRKMPILPEENGLLGLDEMEDIIDFYKNPKRYSKCGLNEETLVIYKSKAMNDIYYRLSNNEQFKKFDEATILRYLKVYNHIDTELGKLPELDQNVDAFIRARIKKGSDFNKWDPVGVSAIYRWALVNSDLAKAKDIIKAAKILESGKVNEEALSKLSGLTQNEDTIYSILTAIPYDDRSLYVNSRIADNKNATVDSIVSFLYRYKNNFFNSRATGKQKIDEREAIAVITKYVNHAYDRLQMDAAQSFAYSKDLQNLSNNCDNLSSLISTLAEQSLISENLANSIKTFCSQMTANRNVYLKMFHSLNVPGLENQIQELKTQNEKQNTAILNETEHLKKQIEQRETGLRNLAGRFNDAKKVVEKQNQEKEQLKKQNGELEEQLNKQMDMGRLEHLIRAVYIKKGSNEN